MKSLFNATLLVLILISSCKQKSESYPPDIAQLVVNDTSTKQEVKSVLDHFSAPADSLKLQAAYYLLRSLKHNHFVDHKLIDKYYDYVKMVKRDLDNGPYILSALQDIYGPYSRTDEALKYDISELKSQEIIDNIEMAFKTRAIMPWTKDIPFALFCEYILPFRAYNEYPDYETRKAIFEQLYPVLDSLKTRNASITSATKAISAKLKKDGFQITNRLMFLPYIRPSKLLAYRGGTCWDMSTLTMFVMRSCGIPATCDFVPQWPTRNGGHSWNVLITEKGIVQPFSAYGQSFDVYASKFLKKGKVFRNMSMPQQEALAMQKLESDTVPAFFLNPKLKDVTDQYVPAFDVKIDIPKPIGKHKYAYICVFDNNKWIPIHWARIIDCKAIFSKMEDEIVYLPAVYENGIMKAIAQPIIVDKYGKVNELGRQNAKINIEISSIHPLLPHYIKNNLLTGGTFQASNNPDFRSAKNLYFIKNEPNRDWTNINIRHKGKYRYVRYLAPKEFSAQAGEIELYSDKKLYGKIIESSHSKFPGSTNTKEKAFDGDPITYYQSRIQGSWIGLDLGKSFNIKKIRFSPVVKSDTTASIVQGHTYKLSHFQDCQWKVVATNIGSKGKVSFTGVPKDGLYMIEDLTQKQWTRIFTYKKGQQVWH